MTLPTNTFATYEAVGNREDLSDVIYRIDPSDTPFMTIGDTDGYTVEGEAPLPPGEYNDALYREVTPGYLEMLGAKVKEGRLLEESDHEGGALVALDDHHGHGQHRCRYGRHHVAGDEEAAAGGADAGTGARRDHVPGDQRHDA